MSLSSNIVLGTLAASLTFGAIQFASGSDLSGAKTIANAEHSGIVNRAAKGDRSVVSGLDKGSDRTRTISFRVERLADTSVLMRLPATAETSAAKPADITKAGPIARRQTVACEPVVSVLTEIAKQLQPGRCVT